MIKFFRKIRQNSIKENRFVNYLKYAFGEIVLVVIGILIALQINNWNEKRIETSRTYELLRSMENDLKSDISFLTTYIKFNNVQVKNSIELLNTPLQEAVNSDSLFRKLPLWTMGLEINSQSFDKIKNASLTNLLGSKKLDSTITDYYIKSTHNTQGFLTWEVNETENDNDFWFNVPNMELPSAFSSENDIAYMQTEGERKQELMRIIDSMDGRKRIRHAMTRKKALTDILRKRIDKAEYLISLIKESL